MKIKREGNNVKLVRNKRRGVKLKVVKGIEGRGMPDCSYCCDLYGHPNSLCAGFFHLCEYLRRNNLIHGVFWFKKI